MLELFEFPPTRSNRAKWAFEEIGVDYTSNMVDLMTNEQQSPEHKVFHPLGHVPVYKSPGFAIHESVAIVLQLLDEHPESGLAPEIGTSERAVYYQWSVFAVAELDHNLFDVMKHTMHLPEDKRNTVIADRARDNFTARALVLCDSLENQDYLLGSEFSGADINIGYCMNWAAYTGMLDSHPILVNYYSKLQSRDAFKKVFTN